MSRRAAARYLAVASAGAALWAGSSAVTRLASLSGETRRFTGSRETGSFSGNGFPSTNWLSDPRPRLDPGTWELRVGGAVDREARWTLADLARQALVTQRATLDCTGGWYTVQEWSGVPMRALIEPAGAASGSHSILVRSATGYRRRYPLDELDRLLLATHVGGEVLSHGHGYPVRLVVPGRRGFEWVKWVVEIELSEEPAWLQSPLPLQ